MTKDEFTEDELSSMVGTLTTEGFELLATPKWDEKLKEWVALMNVSGMLCLCVVKLRRGERK